jgi:hypothetical protein
MGDTVQGGRPSLLRLVKAPEPSLPTHSFAGSRENSIKIKHPGYPDDYEQNVLMVLYAFDRHGGELRYGTALVACALVAGNAWDGFFTRHRDGPPVDLKDDDILLEKSYYFHVLSPSPSSSPYSYAVYPSFEHWSFPHNNLPPAWAERAATAGRNADDDADDDDVGLAPPSASNLTPAILRRDGRCCVTAHKSLSGDYVVDDVCNAMALRSDVHSAFDDRKFVFVPRRRAGSCTSST